MSDAHGVARDQLRSFIERIERLEEEKKTIADDIKDVFGEAKGMGFDTKILKEVIKIRKMDRDERMEREAILDTYLAALGMIEQPDFFAGESYDRSTGELSPKLAHTIVTGMQTQTGRAALVAAVDIMIDREEAQERNTPKTANETPKQVYGDSVEVATAPPSQSVEIPAGGDEAPKIDGSDEQCPADDNSPETATKSGVGPLPGEAGADGPHTPAADERHVEATVEHRSSAPITKFAPSMDELRIANALILRPNCKRPGLETCGGQGRTHCRDCMAAPVEREKADA